MKRLKHVMAGIAFTFAVGLMLSCQVKAETTIDLNGNKVEVSVWTKQTSMKDGSYKIISSEAGTIAYFDKDGNLLKVENKSTGKIILAPFLYGLYWKGVTKVATVVCFVWGW